MSTSADEEGWYSDPYGLHDARWMSEGRPTKLVRDEEAESYDDPPDAEPSATPVRIDASGSADGADLRRADGGTPAASLRRQMSEAGQFGATWGSHLARRPPDHQQG